MAFTSVAMISLLTLTACSGTAAAPSAEQAAAETAAPAVQEATALATVSAVPGYAPGDFPAVPLFTVPDISVLTDSADAFTIDLSADLDDIPGVTVRTAECSAEGVSRVRAGSVFSYEDGAASEVGDGTVKENSGDGSGSVVDDGVVIENNGDGSGTFVGGGVVIENNGDGTGSYVGDDLAVELTGGGAGTSTGGGDVIENNGDGSGSYVGRGMVIENNGDGSGSFTGGGLVIENDGRGTATVNGATIDADPLPPVPPVGDFPPLEELAPHDSCGTVLTFEDGVLFDFDKDAVRPDAQDTLDTVAQVLEAAQIPEAEISGHTDSKGGDDYNQDLSERRARSVMTALQDGGVTSTLTAVGFGETQPVAPNEVDGQDNPAGRQLNRRVEIFIPSF